MNHSPADITRYMLIDLGGGTLPVSSGVSGAWPVFASNEPSSPDNCITLYDTVGQSDGRSMIDGEVWSHYGIQVRVRAISHTVGWIKLRSILVLLSQSVHQKVVTIEGSNYLVHAMAKFGEILVLGKESPTSKRSIFTLNCLASIR